MGNYDDNLVAWTVESGDGVRAINCVNMGRNEGRYGIDTGGGQWVVYDVIKGGYSEAQNGGGRVEMRLSPGEVKVAFVIKEGKSSRRNLRF
jgi:predicted type IV restriction endonuclease